MVYLQNHSEDPIELTDTDHPDPPPYHPNQLHHPHPGKLVRKCLAWTTFGLFGISLLTVIIIFMIRASHPYPKYTRLDYTLVDTYQGEAFFDKFDFFTG